MGQLPADAKAAAAARTIAPYFVPAGKGAKAPDADGFLQRWLLTTSLNKSEWGVVLGLALVMPLVVEVDKWLQRSRHHAPA